MTTTPEYKISRVRITDYRGIAALDETIPPSGKIARGRSESGKTSFLRALQAALGANDIKGDAVRHNAAKAEIIVDLGDLTVRRVISRTSRSTLDVTREGGADAGRSKMTSPQTFLSELIGNAAVDPLELMLAKPPERKQQILSALPVQVTESRLRQWAPDLPTGFSCEGHGLDIVARAHDYFYDLRRTANATAKARATEAERLAGLVQPMLVATPIAEARDAAHRAAAELAALEARERQTAAARERMEASRRKVESLHARANEAEDAAIKLHVSQDELQQAAGETERARDAVTAAELALTAARKALATAEDNAKRLASRAREADEHAGTAHSCRTTADELAGALADVAPAVTPAEIEAARAAVATTTAAVASAEEAEQRATARRLADEAAAEAKAATAAAQQLDATVKRLDNAPAELLAESNGIPGLQIIGDDLALEGVFLSKLSGSQQMKFCVNIAKRLCAKSKILIVDGLERIDADARRDFLTEVTRDGWQLLGSLVERGDMGLVAVEAAAAPAAAE